MVGNGIFRGKRYLLAGLVLILIMTTALTQSSLAATNKASEQAVSLTTNVTAKLHSAHIMAQDRAKIAAITIEITNNSSNRLSLIDYWAKIKTKSGKTFQTKLKESDKSKEQVVAKGSTYLTYYAHVDAATKYSDLAIDLIKWDFSSANYERRLGTLNTSSNTTGEVPVYSTRNVLYGESLVQFGVKQHMLYTDNNSAYLTLSILVGNQALSRVDLSQLKLFLQSSDNKLYPLDVQIEGQALQPQESKVISVQAIIPKSEMNKSYNLIVSSTEEAAKINIPIGVFALAKLSPSHALKVGAVKQTYLAGKKVNISISESSASLSDKKEILKTTVTLENTESSRVTISNLEFYLKTSNGDLYPLDRETEGALTLLPKIKQTFDIKGQIPSQDILKSSEIVVMSAYDDKSPNAFHANFKVSISAGVEIDESGLETNYNGFNIEQTSLSRIPLDLTDLIVAEFAVTNTTKSAMSKLKINGYFMLDDVKLDSSPAQIVELDSLTTIGPNQTYNVIAYMEIPYNQTANKIEFIMQEDAGEEGINQIFRFHRDSLSDPINVTANNGYEITSLGKRAEVKFLNSNIYKGTTTDFFYAELEYTNKERRAIEPAQLAGYIENQDQSIIEVQFSEYKQRILPNGKIILSAWVQMPRAFEESELKFFFGEAFDLKDRDVKAVVKPVLANVAYKEIDVKNDFLDMTISNYLINIRNLYISLNLPDGLNADGISLSFDYDLLKNDTLYPNAEDHQIQIELVDHGNSRLTYTQNLAFDSNELKEDTLLVGKELKKTITFNESGLYFKTDMKSATINIYSVFKENRMLIASRDVNWFVRTP